MATAGAVTMRRGDFPSTGDALLVGWIGKAAFAVYGVALTIAARSYWRRNRPPGLLPVHTERIGLEPASRKAGVP